MIREVKRQDPRRPDRVIVKFVAIAYDRAADGSQGKKRHLGTFDSQREAEAAERRDAVMKEMIAAGEIAPARDTKRTLSEGVTAWLASLKANKSRSYDAYKHRMERILPVLGPLPIARIQKKDVMSWRDQQSGYAATTINGMLICLASAFSWFVDQQWTDKNPCRGLEVRVPKRPYTWIKTKTEITKLLLECPRGIREIVTVALSTGMRIDELVHLQWADIDLDTRLITVHRGSKGTTKSGEPRHVPINDTLLPLLRDMALCRDGSVLVFPGRNGAPRSKPGIREPLRQAVKRAGLHESLRRFHDLRHTFASHWVMEGRDIFLLSRLLGHSSVVITQTWYAHLVPEVWEKHYQAVAFVVPERGTVYGISRRKLAAVP